MVCLCASQVERSFTLVACVWTALISPVVEVSLLSHVLEWTRSGGSLNITSHQSLSTSPLCIDYCNSLMRVMLGNDMMSRDRVRCSHEFTLGLCFLMRDMTCYFVSDTAIQNNSESSDVVLGFGHYLSLRAKLQSLVLSLVLKVRSLVLSLACKVRFSLLSLALKDKYLVLSLVLTL